MLEVDENFNISITRGDTGLLNFTLKNGAISPKDNTVLTVKKNVNTKNALFQTKLDYETQQFIINPEDTSNLEYGRYFYDVQVTTKEGQVFTVITPREFKVEPEVTW